MFLTPSGVSCTVQRVRNTFVYAHIVHGGEGRGGSDPVWGRLLLCLPMRCMASCASSGYSECSRPCPSGPIVLALVGMYCPRNTRNNVPQAERNLTTEIDIITAAVFLNDETVRCRSRRYNVYTYDGTDLPWVVDSGRPLNNVFSDNTITGGVETIRLRVSDGTEFIDNTFKGATAARFDDATETVMSGNTGLDNVKLRSVNGACFDEISDAGFTPIC